MGSTSLLSVPRWEWPTDPGTVFAVISGSTQHRFQEQVEGTPLEVLKPLLNPDSIRRSIIRTLESRPPMDDDAPLLPLDNPPENPCLDPAQIAASITHRYATSV